MENDYYGFGGWHTNGRGRDWINDMFNQDSGDTSVATMQHKVAQHILMTKRVRVSIDYPKDDRALQLLGRAYDIACGKELFGWDGGKAKICKPGFACNCIANLCTNKNEEAEWIKTKSTPKGTELPKGEPVFNFTFDTSEDSDHIHAEGIWDKHFKNQKIVDDTAKHWKKTTEGSRTIFDEDARAEQQRENIRRWAEEQRAKAEPDFEKAAKETYEKFKAQQMSEDDIFKAYGINKETFDPISGFSFDTKEFRDAMRNTWDEILKRQSGA